MRKRTLRKLTKTEKRVQLVIDDLSSVLRRLRNLRPVIGELEADALALRAMEAMQESAAAHELPWEAIAHPIDVSKSEPVR
jgi:hypothetical protein